MMQEKVAENILDCKIKSFNIKNRWFTKSTNNKLKRQLFCTHNLKATIIGKCFDARKIEGNPKRD